MGAPNSRSENLIKRRCFHNGCLKASIGVHQALIAIAPTNYVNQADLIDADNRVGFVTSKKLPVVFIVHSPKKQFASKIPRIHHFRAVYGHHMAYTLFNIHCILYSDRAASLHLQKTSVCGSKIKSISLCSSALSVLFPSVRRTDRHFISPRYKRSLLIYSSQSLPMVSQRATFAKVADWL